MSSCSAEKSPIKWRRHPILNGVIANLVEQGIELSPFKPFGALAWRVNYYTVLNINFVASIFIPVWLR